MVIDVVFRQIAKQELPKRCFSKKALTSPNPEFADCNNSSPW